MTGLREALAGKASQQTHYDLVLGDTAQAEADLLQALADRRLAHSRDDADGQAAADLAVEQARAAVQALTFRVEFRPMPPAAFEQLIAEHEPTAAQRKDGERWNITTFAPALLAACAQDSDLTAQEWAVELESGRWSHADREACFTQALASNVLPRSLSVPKG